MQTTADLPDRFNPNAIVRGYKPVRIDQYQSSFYRLEGYVISNDGRVWACFGNGAKRLSIYPTESALLAAGESDYLERVRRVF